MNATQALALLPAAITQQKQKNALVKGITFKGEGAEYYTMATWT